MCNTFPRDCWTKKCEHFKVRDMSIDDSEVFRKPIAFSCGLETQANKQLLSNCQTNELQSLVGDIVFIKHSPKARIPLRPEGNLSFRVYPCLHDDYIIVEKGKTITIDMGISCYISPDKYIQIHEDFRTNYYGLKISPIIIESNPRFRWHLTITNLNNKTIILSNNKLNHKEIVTREMKKQKKYFKKLKLRKKLRSAFIYDCRSYIAIATVHEFPKINNIAELTYEEYKEFKEEDCNI